MTKYSQYNAQNVLDKVNEYIQILEDKNAQGYDYFNPNVDSTKFKKRGWGGSWTFRIGSVYKELSIFDWWNDTLSLSQLKQMKRFLEQSIKLGFGGYACFKVGAVGCANGMWVSKKESENGYSPDGDCVYHSFVSDENYWDVCINGEWQNGWSNQYKLADIKKILASA